MNYSTIRAKMRRGTKPNIEISFSFFSVHVRYSVNCEVKGFDL